MTHSKKFETVKHFYEAGLWNEIMIKDAVDRWITQIECDEILKK